MMRDPLPQTDAEVLPPPSDSRRALIADVLIDLHQLGHSIITGAMLDRQTKNADWLRDQIGKLTETSPKHEATRNDESV